MASLPLPPDPGLICPTPECGAGLVVIESGWVDPPATGELEPDVAIYTLECPREHVQFQYTTGGLLRPVVD